MWRWLALVILVVVIVLAIVVGRVSDRYLKRTSAAPGPGDIVAVGRYKSGYTPFVCSHWTHVGLVLPTKDGLVVAEMYGYRQPGERRMRRGLYRLPLAEWFEQTKKRELAIARYTGPAIDPGKVEALLDRYAHVKLDVFGPHLLRYLQMRPPTDEIPAYDMCSGMAMRLLQKLGLARADYDPTSYTSSDVLYARFHPIGCRYAPPERLK